MSRIEQALEKAALLRNSLNCDSSNKGEAAKTNTPTVRQCPVPPGMDGSEFKLQIENSLLATLSDPDSPISEEYRKLKSILAAFSQQGEFKNVIMVTSSVGGEGKSLTSLNLAISLAQEFDHTVLLVDADLRKPSIQNYLGMKPGKGLSNYLVGNAELGDLLIKTGIGRLTLLPAGTPFRNPVELFSSQKMKDLITEIKHRYPDRFIIFDTPPILPFAETRSLGAQVDGVIFVIREKQATLDNIGEALNALDRSKLLGAVYNAATAQSLSGRYHYYYHGYGYGSETMDHGLETSDRERKGIFRRMFKRGSFATHRPLSEADPSTLE